MEGSQGLGGLGFRSLDTAPCTPSRVRLASLDPSQPEPVGIPDCSKCSIPLGALGYKMFKGGHIGDYTGLLL